MINEKAPNSPLVSIITVNYDHSHDTIEFLNSMQKVNYPNLEYIVIDNGSEVEDYEKLRNKFPDYQYIRIEKNVGFAGANNRGLEQASGDYILCINNDIIVDPEFLQPLITKLQNNPEIGIVCPKIYFYDAPQNIQFAGYTNFNQITIRNRGIGYNEPDTGQYDKDTFSAFAHGAAMLFPRKVLEEIGLMSEYFFLYYEDMDWGMRVRNNGYQIGFVHNSKVFHKDSVTTGQNSPNFTYYNNRGRLIYMRRNIKLPKIIISTLYLYSFALPKNILSFLIKGESKNAKAFLNAYIWFLLHIFDKNIKQNPKLNN
jgi:GT2 family glycosyltransferase